MAEDSPVALWSLPPLAPRDLLQAGGGVVRAGAPIAWIAPDVGLGAAGFLPLPGGARHLRIESLVGRAALEAGEPDEQVLLELLRRRRGRLDADDVLSCAGIVWLYRGVCRLRGVPAQGLRMEQVVAKAIGARCPDCARAVAIFCALLGDVAARLALASGALGGVYLGGVLVPELAEWFLRSPFRRRFECHGRDRELMRAIPTFVVRRGIAPVPVDPARLSSRSNSLG